jgi:hypothetical protein
VTYLDIARAAVYDTRETRKGGTDKPSEQSLGDEKNEGNEESRDSALLAQEDAEELKSQIIAVATVESAAFDRTEYDRLWARWKAHEAAGGAQ